MDQSVQPAWKQSLTGEPPLSSKAAAVAALLLGDDVLLREVLLRVAFPTSFVRAALVCRRWLRTTIDPGFLRRLHPPLLLDSFPLFSSGCKWPELAVVARRAAAYFAGLEVKALRFVRIQNVCNGRVLVRSAGIAGRQPRVAVCCTLQRPVRPLAYFRVPEGPPFLRNFGRVVKFTQFLPEDSGDGITYFEVSLALHSQATATVCAEFVAYQGGVKGDARRSAPIELPQ